MNAVPFLLVLLAVSLLPRSASANDEPAQEAAFMISVTAATWSGTKCHLTYLVRNRLHADIKPFEADFVAFDSDGREAGQGKLRAGEILRMKPFMRVAPVELPNGRAQRCNEIARIELDFRECTLADEAGSGPAACRAAFRPDEGKVSVGLAGALPEGPIAESEIMELGIRVSPLTPDLARIHRIPRTIRGLVVVERASPESRGLQRGDLVIEVDQDPVESVDALVSKIAAARDAGQRSVLCMVWREGQRHWLVERLPDRLATGAVDKG